MPISPDRVISRRGLLKVIGVIGLVGAVGRATGLEAAPPPPQPSAGKEAMLKSLADQFAKDTLQGFGFVRPRVSDVFFEEDSPGVHVVGVAGPNNPYVSGKNPMFAVEVVANGDPYHNLNMQVVKNNFSVKGLGVLLAPDGASLALGDTFSQIRNSDFAKDATKFTIDPQQWDPIEDDVVINSDKFVLVAEAKVGQIDANAAFHPNSGLNAYVAVARHDTVDEMGVRVFIQKFDPDKPDSPVWVKAYEVKN